MSHHRLLIPDAEVDAAAARGGAVELARLPAGSRFLGAHHDAGRAAYVIEWERPDWSLPSLTVCGGTL